MNHRPFEDWLLADERLSPEHRRGLQAHLCMCTPCAALAEVNLALRSAKTATPTPGFTRRFQARLAERRVTQRKRAILGALVLALGGLGLLAWYTGPFLLAALHSPAELLATWVTYLTSLWISVQTISEVGLVLLRVVPGFVPAYVWMVIASALAGFSLMWVVSIWKFTRIPQGV